MKSLLFFITSLDAGGAEKVLVELLRKIPQEKYEVTLLTLFEGVQDKDVPNHVEHIIYAPHARKAIKTNLLRLCRRCPRLVARLIFPKRHFDIGVAYLEGINTSLLCNARGMGKIVAFLHQGVRNSDFVKTYYGSTKRAMAEYERFDAVCFVSQEVMDEFEVVCGASSRNHVVHNTMDIDAVVAKSLVPITEEYVPGVVRLVTVGRLTPRKRPDRILRLYKRLSRDHSIEWWVIGDGELRGEIVQLRDSLQADRVKLLGYIENPYPYIAKADLMVVTSAYEGYSMVAYEANILGVPVLSSDCAGVRECIGEDGGIIVENSEDGLYRGLAALLSDEAAMRQLKERAMHKKEHIKNDGIAEFTCMLEAIS